MRHLIRKGRLACAALGVALVAAVTAAIAASSISVNDSGTWRTLASIEVNDGGTWRQIKQVQVNDGGTWRTVFASLSASVDSGTASGSCDGLGSCTATTASRTCSAVGGVGPFTYAWSYVSGTAATTTSPSAASTTWQRTAATGTCGVDNSRPYSGTYRCTVTDTATALTATADVSVFTVHNWPLGPCD